MSQLRYECQTHGDWDAAIASGCPDCMAEARQQLVDMHQPRWMDGDPANLAAAAADAYEWLRWLQGRAKLAQMALEDWDKLDRCMEALRCFVKLPNTGYPK